MTLLLLSVIAALIYYIAIYRVDNSGSSKQENGKKCPSCGSPVEKNYNVCPICRETLNVKCPHCGEKLDVAWKYCPYCEKRPEQGESH